jgi:hypothetical protein
MCNPGFSGQCVSPFRVMCQAAYCIAPFGGLTPYPTAGSLTYALLFDSAQTRQGREEPGMESRRFEVPPGCVSNEVATCAPGHLLGHHQPVSGSHVDDLIGSVSNARASQKSDDGKQRRRPRIMSDRPRESCELRHRQDVITPAPVTGVQAAIVYPVSGSTPRGAEPEPPSPAGCATLRDRVVTNRYYLLRRGLAPESHT